MNIADAAVSWQVSPLQQKKNEKYKNENEHQTKKADMKKQIEQLLTGPVSKTTIHVKDQANIFA